MSCNRENVIWQAENGTWSRGFYSVYAVGDTSAEDYDHEWDVDYDYDSFFWIATGLMSEEAAHRAWTGANPGGYTVVNDPAEIKQLDAMAKKLLDEKLWNRR